MDCGVEGRSAAHLDHTHLLPHVQLRQDRVRLRREQRTERREVRARVSTFTADGACGHARRLRARNVVVKGDSRGVGGARWDRSARCHQRSHERARQPRVAACSFTAATSACRLRRRATAPRAAACIAHAARSSASRLRYGPTGGWRANAADEQVSTRPIPCSDWPRSREGAGSRPHSAPFLCAS